MQAWDAGKCAPPVSARGQSELCAGRHTLLLLLLRWPLYLLASPSITAEDERLKLTGLSFPQSCARRLRSSLCLSLLVPFVL